MSKVLSTPSIAKIAGAFLAAGVVLTPAYADEPGVRDIGSVDTTWRMMGANDSIQISAVPDPKIDGITCFLSRPLTGGLSGSLGIAEDKSDASVACRQTGPIVYKAAIEHDADGEEIFNEKRSVLFKSLHVTRFFDAATNSLVYLTYSDKLVDGSPKNAISAVTPMPWGTQAPGDPKLL